MKTCLKLQNGCWNDWNAISVKINYRLKIEGVIKSLDTGIFACLHENFQTLDGLKYKCIMTICKKYGVNNFIHPNEKNINLAE